MLTSKKHVEFAICLANKGYEDLQVWKVYRVLPDAKAAAVGCIRVIDESGEDYLYPEDRFAAVDFPKVVRARLPRWQPSNGPNKALQSTAKSRRRLNA
jgi:transposase